LLHGLRSRWLVRWPGWFNFYPSRYTHGSQFTYGCFTTFTHTHGCWFTPLPVGSHVGLLVLGFRTHTVGYGCSRHGWFVGLGYVVWFVLPHGFTDSTAFVCYAFYVTVYVYHVGYGSVTVTTRFPFTFGLLRLHGYLRARLLVGWLPHRTVYTRYHWLLRLPHTFTFTFLGSSRYGFILFHTSGYIWLQLLVYVATVLGLRFWLCYRLIRFHTRFTVRLRFCYAPPHVWFTLVYTTRCILQVTVGLFRFAGFWVYVTFAVTFHRFTLVGLHLVATHSGSRYTTPHVHTTVLVLHTWFDVGCYGLHTVPLVTHTRTHTDYFWFGFYVLVTHVHYVLGWLRWLVRLLVRCSGSIWFTLHIGVGWFDLRYTAVCLRLLRLVLVLDIRSVVTHFTAHGCVTVTRLRYTAFTVTFALYVYALLRLVPRFTVVHCVGLLRFGSRLLPHGFVGPPHPHTVWLHGLPTTPHCRFVYALDCTHTTHTAVRSWLVAHTLLVHVIWFTTHGWFCFAQFGLRLVTGLFAHCTFGTVCCWLRFTPHRLDYVGTLVTLLLHCYGCHGPRSFGLRSEHCGFYVAGYVLVTFTVFTVVMRYGLRIYVYTHAFIVCYTLYWLRLVQLQDILVTHTRLIVHTFG